MKESQKNLSSLSGGFLRAQAFQWVGLTLGGALLFLTGCDSHQIAACTDQTNMICGILRPVDIEPIPDTEWMVVSERGGSGRPGGLRAVDRALTRNIALLGRNLSIDATDLFPKCGAPPDDMRPLGIHISVDENQSLRLLAVDRTRIERFRVEIRGGVPHLTWEGCVTVPDDILAKDVGGFRDGDFVVTGSFKMPPSRWLTVRFLLGLDTGYAIIWSAQNGWIRVPNSEASMPNGVQIDPDTSRIYISSKFQNRIISIARDGSNRMESEHGPAQLYILTWSGDRRLIGTGHTGMPVYGVSKCQHLEDLGDSPCSFPFAVIAYNKKDLSQETIFTSFSKALPGGSVGVLVNDELYLGTDFGDRITKIQLSH